MTTFYTLAARLCGVSALVCALLALLTHPSVARADDLSDCYDQCAAIFPPSTNYPDFVTCTGSCQGDGRLQGGGCSNSGCSKTCIGSFPTCGNGDCSKKAACVTVGCQCKLVYVSDTPRLCECKV